jgi:hypothetical protein
MRNQGNLQNVRQIRETEGPRRFCKGPVLVAYTTRQIFDDDEDEYEAPGEHLRPAMRVLFGPRAVLQPFATPTPLFEHEDDFDAPGKGGRFVGRYPG